MTHWQKTGKKFLNLLVQPLTWILYGICWCIWFAIISFLWLGDKLINSCKWMFANTKRFVILLILFLTALTLAAILPATHNFEGQLIVREMTFTYAGDNQNKLFLNSIRGINEISASGIQTLTLTGKFESKYYPQLNKLNTLTIELPNETSKWSISPANSKEINQVELRELRLQPDTIVKGLRYNSYDDKNTKVNRLSLSLQPSVTEQKNHRANLLQLAVGDKPLKLQLEDYRLPKLKLPTNPNNTNPFLEVIFKPDIQELMLPLPPTTDLVIDLPDPKKSESSQWLRGNIEVKDVRFYEIEKTGVDVKDELSNSTIMEGKLRMAGQERNIELKQFLIVEQPGVKLLRNIQLHPESPLGLEVRISGRSNRLQVGLDSRFPVATIQASWLDGNLPRDAIIALISFSAATFSYLLYWLVDQSAKSNQKS